MNESMSRVRVVSARRANSRAMRTMSTAFRDADDEERRRLLPDRSSAPSSRGNRRNTHRSSSSSSSLLGALASASIVALVGVRARGGSMTTNESSASLGEGRSRSQMLSGLAAAPCLDKCAGAERDGAQSATPAERKRDVRGRGRDRSVRLFREV